MPEDALTIAKKVEARFDMHVKQCDERTVVFNEGIGRIDAKLDGVVASRVKQDRRVLLWLISILGALLLSVGAFLGQEVWRKTHPAEAASSHSVPAPRR